MSVCVLPLLLLGIAFLVFSLSSFVIVLAVLFFWLVELLF